MGTAYGSINMEQVSQAGHMSMNQGFPISGTPINEIVAKPNAETTTQYAKEQEDMCEPPPQCMEQKDIHTKLKQLETHLHYNFATDTKSACFWCTYSFDNPAVFIPKHYLKDAYQVYGCFCSPECGVAYLMNENLDATKFERYYLMNNIYGKIYNYNKNIKPAPDPHYTLDKFCGNLNIQEYRSMLSNERLYIVVDKPLTRIMPEIHQTNEDHIINSKMIPSNQNVKRPTKRNMNKNEILAENFGIGGAQA